MTKLEILEETVKFYSEDVTRRSVVPTRKRTSCVYNSPQGKHCAVGRCFLPELKAEGEKFAGNSDTTPEDLLRIYSIETMDALLEEKYRGHSTYFWQELQTLHDTENFWCDKGLTRKGEEKVERIKSTFGLYV
jgi:hypothetical protein